MLWVDEGVPSGAVTGGDGGDTWSWVTTPTPVSGKVADQSGTAAGLHLHYFDLGAGNLTLTPVKPLHLRPSGSGRSPTEAMLEFNNGTWEHRAYSGR